MSLLLCFDHFCSHIAQYVRDLVFLQFLRVSTWRWSWARVVRWLWKEAAVGERIKTQRHVISSLGHSCSTDGEENSMLYTQVFVFNKEIFNASKWRFNIPPFILFKREICIFLNCIFIVFEHKSRKTCAPFFSLISHLQKLVLICSSYLFSWPLNPTQCKICFLRGIFMWSP